MRFFFVIEGGNMIKSRNLAFDYITRDENDNVTGIKRALDDVNINVKKGQFIAIIGGNGSGKSTFAKHLNAILLPTEGTVYVDGNNTLEEGKRQEIRQKSGMVFQNPDNQILGATVEEDVGFGPENLGIHTKEIWERVEGSLKKLGIYEYAKYSPNNLSGGQKQKVVIAGTLAMKPQCIVLDEPTSMLDPEGRKEVIDSITQLNREENITVILITHYLEEVVNADYIYVMNDGKVILEGRPGVVFAREEFLEECGIKVPSIVKLNNILQKSNRINKSDAFTVEELAKKILENMK